MRNYLTFAGRDSRDFGVYISGQGTFSAPQKAYAFYNVPGRNGAILGNDHRLENIEVSYECFIYKDFKKNIADFRTFLLSCDGYQKLTDSYHTDEYRSAVYVGAFEPEVTSKNDAGSFTLTFNCKPQRWLVSGDTVYSWMTHDDNILSGSELYVYSALLDENVFMWKYSKHTLDGDPEEDPAILISRHTLKQIRVDYDGNTVCDYDYSANKSSSWPTYTECEIDLNSGEIQSGLYGSLGAIVKQNWQKYTGVDRVWYHTFAEDQFFGCSLFKRVYASDIASAIPLMREYMHSCYYDEQNKLLYIYIQKFNPNATPQAVANYLSIHGVLWDVIFSSGGASHTLNNWTAPDYPETRFAVISDGYNKNAVTFLMQYSDNDSMYNPTFFPSAPMIRAYGDGSFSMDGVTITITNTTSYTDIDCELMDCYEESTNRNNDVTFSTYDFPKLQPGSNVVDIISGITILEITPRWWRV